MEKLKICILTPHAPTLTGSSIQSFRLALKLKEMGTRIFMVFSLNVGTKNTAPCYATVYEKKALAAGISVYKKPDDIITKWDRYKFYLKLFWHKRQEYQLVYINGMPQSVPFFVLIFKLLGKKVVVKMTGLGLNDPDSLKTIHKYSWCDFKLLSLADKFVGTSTALCKAYRQSELLPKNKLVQIPNGVDTEFFTPLFDNGKKQALKKKLGLPLDAKIVTYIGGVRKEKGLDFLLNTWDYVIRQYPKAILLIIGPLCPVCPAVRENDQEFINLLKEKAGLYFLKSEKSLTLLRPPEPKNNIYVLNAQENINEFLQVSDIFLFFSRLEGMPNAIMEAMASGLPCITQDIEEISGDLITHNEMGFAIRGENVEPMSKAIVELLNDEAKRAKIGQAARQKMEDEFDIKKIAQQHYSLYRQLVG